MKGASLTAAGQLRIRTGFPYTCRLFLRRMRPPRLWLLKKPPKNRKWIAQSIYSYETTLLSRVLPSGERAIHPPLEGIVEKAGEGIFCVGRTYMSDIYATWPFFAVRHGPHICGPYKNRPFSGRAEPSFIGSFPTTPVYGETLTPRVRNSRARGDASGSGCNDAQDTTHLPFREDVTGQKVAAGRSPGFRIILLTAPSRRHPPVVMAAFVPGHSGGSAPDSHRLPGLSPRKPTCDTSEQI